MLSVLLIASGAHGNGWDLADGAAIISVIRLQEPQPLRHRHSRTDSLEAKTLRTSDDRVSSVLWLDALYRWAYFGCGHVEAAFYELDEQITIYAFRDSACANARRVGWRAIAQRLGSERNDIEILRALVAELERAGLSVSLASAAECVELALNRRLVPPCSLQRTCVALETKDRRLAQALAMTPTSVDPRPIIPLPIRGA